MDIDRTRRVGELIQRELALLINAELSDPRIDLVTLTGVELTRDLKQAKIFVTELNTRSDSTEHKQLIDALNSASGYLKHLLSQKLDLRATPRLRFIYDNSIERGLKLSQLIDEARKKDND